MGLLDKLSDAAVRLTSGKDTIRVPYNVLADLIEQEFIAGADEAFLEQIRKTAKGGIFFPKEMKSTNERYDFRVGALQRGLWLLRSRSVWVLDNEEGKFYQLDRDRKWSKFYKAIDLSIKTEIINRRK